MGSKVPRHKWLFLDLAVGSFLIASNNGRKGRGDGKGGWEGRGHAVNDITTQRVECRILRREVRACHIGKDRFFPSFDVHF